MEPPLHSRAPFICMFHFHPVDSKLRPKCFRKRSFFLCYLCASSVCHCVPIADLYAGHIHAVLCIPSSYWSTVKILEHTLLQLKG